MKLLFDENLSPVLPRLLDDIFPGSAHLRDVSLRGSDDGDIWSYAAAHGFVIVTKDDDFRELSILRGAPPKVVMIELGNCTTAEVGAALRKSQRRILAFEAEEGAALLELTR